MGLKELVNEIRIPDLVRVQNEFWFVDCVANAICKMDLSFDNMQIVRFLPADAPIWIANLFYHREKLLIFERGCSSIFAYDIKEDRLEQILADDEQGGVKANTSVVIQSGDLFYSIPWFAGRDFYVYDARKNCISKKPVPMQEVLRKKLVRAGDTFAVSAAILGKSLFLPIYRTNVVMEYDTLEETAQFHVLNEEVRLLHCTVNDESLWLLTEDSNTVLQWDKKEGIKDKIELIPQEDTDNFSGKIFGRMFSYENSLIILPRFSDIFSIVDLSSKTAKLQDLKGMGIQRIAGYNESNSLFWQGLVNENKLYLPPWSSEKLVIFELKSQIIHSVSMKRQEDDWKRIIAHTYQNRQVFYEREKMSLEDYLAILDEGKQ